MVNVKEAREGELNNKLKIDKLQLKWKHDNLKLPQEGIGEEVLKGL